MINSGNLPPGMSMRQLKKMARKLAKANPELRKMYEQSQAANPDLDTEVNDLTEELEEILDVRNNTESKSE